MQEDDVTAQAQTEATILELRAQLEAMSARLAQLESAATVAPAAAPDGNGKIGRRGLLTQALGAAAAATVLSVAKDAATAEASSRTTVIGASTANYGLAAAPNNADPNALVPNLNPNGVTRTYGVIGVLGNPGVVLDRDAGVLGLGTGGQAGILGYSGSGFGVRGESGTGAGVSGYGAQGTGNGVLGVTTGNTTSSGVYGLAGFNQIGVSGVSTQGIGVYANCAQGAAVYAFTQTSTGVYGVATTGIGVRGESAGTAVLGSSPGGVAVVGQTNTGFGVRGESTTTTGYAGYFAGRVFVEGDFTALGIKSAAVRTNKQDLARVYCVEGTEAWLEDRGSARLNRNGRRIQVDDEFASTISGDYHVTITGYNAENPLLVVDKDANGFLVIEQGNPNSTAEFSYCIWGKRKDIPNVRLSKVERKERDEERRARDEKIKRNGRVELSEPIVVPVPANAIPDRR
jgi:hypothetical protein